MVTIRRGTGRHRATRVAEQENGRCMWSHEGTYRVPDVTSLYFIVLQILLKYGKLGQTC